MTSPGDGPSHRRCQTSGVDDAGPPDLDNAAVLASRAPGSRWRSPRRGNGSSRRTAGRSRTRSTPTSRDGSSRAPEAPRRRDRCARARGSRRAGAILHQVSAALRAVVGCQKTYVLQLAESGGQFHHVHFHVVPRRADLPDKYGASASRAPRQPGARGRDRRADRGQELALSIRAELARSGPRAVGVASPPTGSASRRGRRTLRPDIPTPRFRRARVRSLPDMRSHLVSDDSMSSAP